MENEPFSTRDLISCNTSAYHGSLQVLFSSNYVAHLWSCQIVSIWDSRTWSITTPRPFCKMSQNPGPTPHEEQGSIKSKKNSNLNKIWDGLLAHLSYLYAGISVLVVTSNATEWQANELAVGVVYHKNANNFQTILHKVMKFSMYIGS